MTSHAKPITISRGVIEALNEELAFQSIGDSECVAAEDDGVSGQLVALATHNRRAQDAWTGNASVMPALHELRIIAAIAIRALELYGCPRRYDEEAKL